MSAPLIPDYKKLGYLFGHDGVAEKRLMTTKEKFHPTASNDEIVGGTIQLIGNMSSQSAGQPNAFCIEKLDDLFGRDGATEKRSMTTKEKLFQLASVNEIDGGIIQLIDNVFPLQPNASSSSERKKRNGEKKELKQPNASSSSMRKR